MTKTLTTFYLLLLGLANQPATACSCIGKSTVEEAYKNADIVATGQVISIKVVWLPDSMRIKEMEKLGFAVDSQYGYFLTSVLMKVNAVYKGKNTSDTVTIYTGMGVGDCGFLFKEGRQYLIYGDTDSYFGHITHHKPSGKQSIFWTNSCTRTQECNLKKILAIRKIQRKLRWV